MTVPRYSVVTAEDLKEIQRVNEMKLSLVTKIVQDIIRHIRRQWDVKQLPKDPRKVIRRTSQVLHFEPAGDSWNKKRERHFREVECAGLFSDPWYPYQEVGGVELDTYKLVVDHLVPALNLTERKIRNVATGTSQSRRTSRWSILERMMLKEEEIPEKFDDVTGIQAIREGLKFVLALYSAVQGRQNFPGALRKLRKQEECHKAAKPLTTMQAIPIMMCEDPQRKEKEELLQGRKIRYFCQKIKCIHHLLTSMINMKDKDLRHKSRLSPEAIVRLRTTRDLDCPLVVPVANVLDVFNNMKPCVEPKTSSEMFVMREVAEQVGQKPPLWQNLNSISMSTAGKEYATRTDDVPAEDVVHYLRSSLLKKLEKTRNRHLHQLERLDRELVHRYKYTFLALSVLPLSLLRHTQMLPAAERLEELDMRAAVSSDTAASLDENSLNLILKHILTEDPSPEFCVILELAAKPATKTYEEAPDHDVWYQLLVEESQHLRIADAECVCVAMRDLAKFNGLKVGQIPHAQEKLCMLVMSMSAKDMCTKHWQMAAKFILEEIMDGHEGTIELWLDSRSLPILTL